MNDRTILVTGAASGIGAATCRTLAAPGIAIMVHTRRNAAGANRIADEIIARGAEAEVVLADLAEPDAAGKIVQATVARFDRLDVVV